MNQSMFFQFSRKIYPCIGIWLIFTAVLFSLISDGCTPERIVESQNSLVFSGRSFAIIGDTRSNPDVFQQHVWNMSNLESHPSFLFHTGDVVSDNEMDFEWKIFHSIISPFIYNVRFYPAVGNHDVGSNEGAREKYKLEMGIDGELYYSLDDHSILFIILSTEEPGYINQVGGDQLSWLAETLANAITNRIVVFMHRPLFPQGHFKGEGLSNADTIHQILANYGVDIVFTGHEHQFFIDKFDGITYVVTGGGGAPLHHENGGDFYHFILACPTENKLTLYIITLDGKIWGTHEIPFE